MLPIPTRTAVAAFVGCTLVLAIGIFATSVAAIVMASSGFVGLALALAATMPRGRRVRRQRLEFAWWLGHGEPGASGGAVVPGAPFEVRCYIRHRGDDALLLASVGPIVPAGATLADDEPRELVLHPRARNEFSFRLVAPAVGRVVLHGLAVTLRGPFGLFEVPLYFPNPLVIKVLPRAAAVARGGTRVITGIPVERSGRTVLRRRGGGTELYELRDFQPGDPFNAIAWKASARMGRLLVKEVEAEVQETRWIVVDISGTMRGGPPGSRKLDFAIEAAAAEARRAIDHGDRVGLATVDGRIVAQVQPKDGVAQMIRIYDALLAATEVVDADMTDIEDDEVVAIVGRYVRHQDGVDFSSAAARGWEVRGLVAHVAQALANEPDAEDVGPNAPAGRVLRRFCRARGIPLPYRADPRDGSKAPALAEALRAAGGRSRVPSSIVVITDFDGAGTPDVLLDAVKLVRAHRHGLAFVVPDAVAFAPAPDTAIARDLHAIYARSETRRIRDARAALGRLGVPVLVAKPEDTPSILVARAQRLQRVA